MTHNSDDHLRRLLATVRQLLPISIECVAEDADRGVKAGWLEYARDIISDVEDAADAAAEHLHDT
jgi:predicted transcriptional regulator